jgi:adenylate kinase
MSVRFVANTTAMDRLTMTGKLMGLTDHEKENPSVAGGTKGTDTALASVEAQKEAAFEAETLTHKDSTLQDAQMIFDLAWQNIEKKHGRDNCVFPKELLYLGGAPGSGKGTMSGYIRKMRDISAPAVEVSGLLQGEKFQKIKDEGGLVGDQDVLEALLEELLQPCYAAGVVIDGFPRTHLQAQCIKLLYDKMRWLRQRYSDDVVLRHRFRR